MILLSQVCVGCTTSIDPFMRCVHIRHDEFIFLSTEVDIVKKKRFTILDSGRKRKYWKPMKNFSQSTSKSNCVFFTLANVMCIYKYIRTHTYTYIYTIPTFISIHTYMSICEPLSIWICSLHTRFKFFGKRHNYFPRIFYFYAYEPCTLKTSEGNYFTRKIWLRKECYYYSF